MYKEYGFIKNYYYRRQFKIKKKALKQGLEETGKVSVLFDCESGEAAIEFCQD